MQPKQVLAYSIGSVMAFSTVLIVQTTGVLKTQAIIQWLLMWILMSAVAAWKVYRDRDEKRKRGE